MVKLIITQYAKEDLKKIHRLYKDYPIRDNEIRQHIKEGFATLKRFPQAGVVMDRVDYDSLIYRSLVIDKHYKIIYTVVDKVIWILSIFDCRQDPLKLFDTIQ